MTRRQLLHLGLTVGFFVLSVGLMWLSMSLFHIKEVNNQIIFIALLPFLFYLIVSGKVLELKGGGLELKFNQAKEANVLFEEAPVEYIHPEIFAKGGREMLDGEIVPKMVKAPFAALSVVSGRPYYDYEVTKLYLERLTEFETFKYLLFLTEDGLFLGFIPARHFLALLKREAEGRRYVELINSNRIEEIPGLRKDAISSKESSRRALERMDRDNLTDIAVVDEHGKFLGFANRERLISKLVYKAVVEV